MASPSFVLSSAPAMLAIGVLVAVSMVSMTARLTDAKTMCPDYNKFNVAINTKPADMRLHETCQDNDKTPVLLMEAAGKVTSQGNVSATHLEFLVDDSLKQNVTFADKKKMLANVIGLKVADYALTDDFLGKHDDNLFYRSNGCAPTFSGEPPHWYKAAYYRGILAESLAYNLPQALSKVNISNSNSTDHESCCSSNPKESLEDFNTLWFAKLDTVVTEVVGAVQALAVANFDVKGLAGLKAASAIGGGGGPVSLGMFIGAVLETVAHKGFGEYSKSKSATPTQTPTRDALAVDAQEAASAAAESVTAAAAEASAHASNLTTTASNLFETAYETLRTHESEMDAAIAAAELKAAEQQARIDELLKQQETERADLKALEAAVENLTTRQAALRMAVRERIS